MLPDIIQVEDGKLVHLYETGEESSPWDTLRPKAGGGLITFVSGLKQWSIQGLPANAESFVSVGTGGNAAVIPQDALQPNPSSSIHRREKRQLWISKISVDPDVRGGVPTVGEDQWPVTHILEALAAGISPRRLIEAQPGLTLADIQMALTSASWVMRDPAIDWSALDLPAMVEFQNELRAWQGLTHDGWEHMDDLQGE